MQPEPSPRGHEGTRSGSGQRETGGPSRSPHTTGYARGIDPLLDNPIWHALTSEQVRFAERDGDAARFPSEVTGLAGMREASRDVVGALVRLLPPGEVTGILLDRPLDLPAALEPVDAAPVLQMVHDGPAPEAPGGLEELGPDDAPAMLALAEATRPGPFGTRTHELGTFLGVRAGGRLVAMAGQRMRLPGLIEVSGVCTDPAHLGRGHAARLLAAQLALIRGAGDRVFLHVKADNARAIAVYERPALMPGGAAGALACMVGPCVSARPSSLDGWPRWRPP